MTPIGPHDPPSAVHMQTTKLQQLMVQSFLTAGTTVAEGRRPSQRRTRSSS